MYRWKGDRLLVDMALVRLGIIRLYCGKSGKMGYYNSQEIGLAREMKKIGYVCYIFYPDITFDTKREVVIEDGIVMVYCPARSIGVHSWYDWDILKYYHLDVVEVETDNQLFATSVIKFCDKHGILAYHYIGAVDSDTTDPIKKIISRILYQRTLKTIMDHKVFVKTDAVYKRLQSKGIKDITLAPVGLDISTIPDIREDTQSIRKRLGLPIEKKIVLFVGRMDGYKKPYEMLSVLKKLDDLYFGVMIGDGILSDGIDEKIVSLGLTNKISRIKQIPNVRIHEYYAASDLFLNFNPHEIFGMSILEAMYQGMTVIAFHAPGPDMIIENGVTGYLVDQIDEMEQMIKNKVLLDKETVKRRVLDGFVWEKTAKKMDEWMVKKGFFI